MHRIDVAQDIVSVGDLKEHTSQLLEQLHATRRPIVITRNGKAAAVLLTPREFEDLSYQELVRAKVQAGIESVATGESLSPTALRKRMKAKLRALRED